MGLKYGRDDGRMTLRIRGPERSGVQQYKENNWSRLKLKCVYEAFEEQ